VKRKFISAAVMLALCFLWGGVARADNLHLCDINAVCNSGSVISIQSSNLTDFANGKTYGAGATLYLLVLNPVSGTSGNWNGGNLWNVVLGSSPQNYPTLASAISQEQIGTGMVVGSFNVSSISQGSWNGSATITLPGGPIGTIYMLYVLDASGNLVAVTPWSSSLINVPEPSSFILLGAGLLALALASRKLMTA
jgi:hypothetical protein